MLTIPKSSLRAFTKFCVERESIRIRRELEGRPYPWTDDRILGTFSFCNVNREHDRVTRWIDANIRQPYAYHPLLWFNLCVARLFNWPDTLRRIGFVKKFSPDTMLDICHSIRIGGGKLFTGAYIVSTNGLKMDKAEYVVRKVLAPLWDHRRYFHRYDIDGSSCAQWAELMGSFNGLGGFMVNQIITDLKYTPILRDAPDWRTFVIAGPGTKRGLNRLMKRGKNYLLSVNASYALLHLVRDAIGRQDVPGLSLICKHFNDMNNLSNCFCEWDKYERVRLGEGRPRALYKPGPHARCVS